MGYGTYDRQIIDASNSDIGQGAVTATNLSAALGVLALYTKTAKEPMTVDRFGFNPVTALVSLTTNGQLGLYRYPQGMICVDLPTAIDLCNSLLTAMNAHAADGTMHTTHVDATNFPVDATPVTDLATLLVKVNLLTTAYDAHDDDAQLANSWVFHIAQATTGALSAETTITTLAGAITRLNDMLVKYNLHDVGVVAHAIGNLHPAYKVLLAIITLINGDLVGYEYVCDVDNLPVKAEYPYQGVAIRGVADIMPGDQVAIEVLVLAVGSVSGTYKPFFAWHNRAEAEGDLPYLVNRTPVKTAVANNLVGD